MLHPRSGAKGPLVVTDLSTVPAALLPSHLFGARRGAYTGATEDHAGVFEQAHGGTLFLDEIGNLELDLQRQLLLVLEARRGHAARRCSRAAGAAAAGGGDESRSRRARRAGRFRQDLYMRLNPATRLRVPALRERSEDLPALVSFALLEALRSEALSPLVRQYLARFPTPDDFVLEHSVLHIGRPSLKGIPRDAFAIFLSKDSLAALTAHAWPGNHRELRLLAVNALVAALAQALDTEGEVAQRAPAVLQLPDALIAQLLEGALGGSRAREAQDDRSVSSRAHSLSATTNAKSGAARKGRAIEVSLAANRSFAEVAAEVERQYLRALFDVHAGDLGAMAEELLGPGAPARKIHLRLNQLGMRVRDLREGKE